MNNNEDFHKIYFLTLIAGRKEKDNILTALSDSGVHLLAVMYGKGSVKGSYLMEVLGLTPEENKVIITCVVAKKKSDAILKMLVEKFDFNTPNTGIAFTIPVESLSF